MNEFAAVAEFAVGFNTLDRFIVTNDHDASIMRKLRSQAGCNQDCGIFLLQPSRRYNIPGPIGIEGIERISDVFSIDNDIVFNCLIDNCRMEQKAVARDRLYSQDKLLEKNGSQYKIRENIKEVYLPTGDYWTVKGGSLAVFSNEKKLRQTVGVDRSEAIADAEAHLSSLEQEMQGLKHEESKLQHEHTAAQKQWNLAKRAVIINNNEISAMKEKIEAIKEEMKARTDHTIDTTEFEEDIQQAEDLLARHIATEEKYLSDREGMLPRINELKEQLNECSIRSANIVESIAIAEQELTQFLETQTQQNDKLEKKRLKLQKYQADLTILEEQLDSIGIRRDDYLQKARTMHFRVQQQLQSSEKTTDEPEYNRVIRTDPTTEELEAIEPIVTKHEPSWYEIRLQKVNLKIQSEKERRKVSSSEDAATVYERYSRAKADLTAKTEQVAETDDRIEELKKDVDERRKRWRQFRKHLAKSTGLKFDEMLTMNKYTGTLDFDDEKGTLDLSVQKMTTDNQSESKDVKALRYETCLFLF
jgi:chromosome segregation ATPase